jgi:hypothetical protein
VVSQIEKVLAKLADDPDLLEQLRQRGMHYARECLSWDGKAQVMTQILTWVVGQGPKPDLQPRKDAAPTANEWQKGRSAGCESSLLTSAR